MVFVEAIEEGKIVKVEESYAREEGLPVLRKCEEELEDSEIKRKQREEYSGSLYGVSDLSRPLNKDKNQVVMELVDNFHWEISKERRKRNLSRKKFGEVIGESESVVKMVENGILPSEDFFLINKIQDKLGINLRKDGKDFQQSARGMLDKDKEREIGEKIEVAAREGARGRLYGDSVDIDIVENEKEKKEEKRYGIVKRREGEKVEKFSSDEFEVFGDDIEIVE